MRRMLAAAAAVLGLTAPAAPAANEDIFVGTMTIDCFGCGGTTATAELSVNLGGHASMLIDLYQPPGLCPARGFGFGTISGYYEGTVSFEHHGTVLTLSVYPAHGRGGTAVGWFKSDAVNPCGSTNVTATLAGVLAGL